MSTSNSIVTLNVGGHIYTTTRSTLTRYPDSMLGAMFAGDMDTLQDDQGRCFVDRDGTLFQYILNFLRTSQLVLPEDFKKLSMLEIEADFYQIQPLIEAVQSYKARLDPSTSGERNAHDVVMITVNTRDGYMASTGNGRKVVATREVKDMVDHINGEIFGETDQHTYATLLLKGLQDNGFTVQSYGVIPHDDTRFDDKHIWVLVRKTVEKSDSILTKNPYGAGINVA